MESGGDIGIELANTDAIKLLIESALSDVFEDADGTDGVNGKPNPTPPANAPGVAPETAQIEPSTTKVQFAVEVRFPDPINAGEFLYQRYVNCLVDSMSISADPENPVTATFTLMGSLPAAGFTDESIIAGATYEYPATTDVYRGPDFLTIQIGSITAALPCMNTLSLNLSANSRGQKCLGTLGNKDILVGQRSPDGNASVYYTSNDLLNAMEAQTEFKLTVEMLTSAGSYFAIEQPRCKLTQDPVVATGTNTDVMDDIAWQASYDTTATTSMIVWLEG